ncbi:hypothetical protein HZC34_06830 [Candidatus Saganbacteria bacterium]|nr:hypothetical protein [Candidatus Saganbacteria bacterium]
MTNLNLRLTDEINRFFEVYSILSPEGKATFEAQMGPTLANSDPNTRKLYQILLKAVKDGLTIETAIEQMKKSSI